MSAEPVAHELFPVEPPPPTERERWLEERRNYITASDAPVVLQVSPWKSRLELFTEKRGLAPEDKESERMAWGRLLQTAIGEGYAERTGRAIQDNGLYTITQHPEKKWMAATLDFRQVDATRGPGILEVKNSEPEWGDEPPTHYQVQLQHQMAVAGVPWGTLAVLQRGNRLKWYDVDRNDRFIALMMEQEEEFMGRVVANDPPPVDGSEGTAHALRLIYPKDAGTTVALPPEALDIARDLEKWEAAAEEAKREIDARKNWIRAQIGDATYGVMVDGRAWSWKARTKRAYTVPASEYRELRRMAKRER